MKTCIIFALTIAAAFNVYAAPTLRYSGTVRDFSGAPAADVRVTFYPGFYRGAGHYAMVKTDANGRYEIIQQQQESSGFFSGRINPTNSIMACDLERNLAAIQEFSETPTDIDLTLQPGIILSGSVKDIQGAPLRDATVEIEFLSGNFVVKLREQPTGVNAQGFFSISALPQGREYRADGVTAKGYGSAFGRVEAKHTLTNSYEFPTFVLRLADRRLAGQVVGSDGKPLVGARVIFSGQGQPHNPGTRTDSKGNFDFDAVCDGPLKVFANYQDPLDRSIFMSLNGGGGMEAEGGTTNILIELHDTSISAWDVPTLITTGTVFDHSGNPDPSVSFVVWRSANRFKSFWSDLNGKFRVRWQRPLGVQFSPPSVLVARDPAHNLVATHDLDETNTNLDLNLQSGCALSGSVQDSDGRPLTNATVSLTMSFKDARAELGKVQTDANGSFSLNALPQEGEYYLDVNAPGYSSAAKMKAQFTGTRSDSLQLPPIKLLSK